MAKTTIPDLRTIRDIAREAWKDEKTVRGYYRWKAGEDVPKPRPMTVLAIESAIERIARGKVR